MTGHAGRSGRADMNPAGYVTKSGGRVRALGATAFRLIPTFIGKRADAAIDVQLVADDFVVFSEIVRVGSMRRRNELLAAWEGVAPRLLDWRSGKIIDRAISPVTA